MTPEQMTQALVDMERENAALKEQTKTIFSRLDKQDTIIELLRTQTSTIGTLADGQARIEKKVNGLTGEIDEIKAKPARKWENAADVAFKLILTAAMGILLARVGLG